MRHIVVNYKNSKIKIEKPPYGKQFQVEGLKQA